MLCCGGSCCLSSLGWLVRSNLHDSHGVVVKDGGDIFRGELVGCVGDEQTGLSDSTVPHHDTSAVGVSHSQERGDRGKGRGQT